MIALDHGRDPLFRLAVHPRIWLYRIIEAQRAATLRAAIDKQTAPQEGETP